MTYLNTHARTVSPTKNSQMNPIGRTNVLFGVFLGYVKETNDVQRNGRLRVWVPELGSAPDDENGWIIANYCSPFAGATNVEASSKTHLETFSGTQTSYGMWFVPPDINNQVLIMFINGDPSRAIWIGSLYNQFMNNMVPGIPGSENNYQYPGKDVPVAEYNKWDGSITDPETAERPYEKTKFNGISNQGLITDTYRGVQNASARRESPSAVFGILTPGPILNTGSSTTFDQVRRTGGSSFVMDDGVGSESISLATKSGAQIRIDETNGFIYVINRDGTGWIQIDQKGNIDIFGANSISLRAQQDINFRADRNINIEAGQNVFIKAAKDTITSTTTFTYDINNTPNKSNIEYNKYVGEGNGTGGNIVFDALNDVHSTIANNSYITIDGNQNINIGNSYFLTTVGGTQEFNSARDIDITSNTSVNISAATTLIMDAKGNLSISAEGDFLTSTTGKMSIHASGSFGISSPNIGFTGNTIFGGTVGVTGVLNVAGGANLGGQVALGGSVSVSSPVTPDSTLTPILATTSTKAEVKPLNEKINILATWTSSNKYNTWQQNVSYKTGDIVSYQQKLYIAMSAVPASNNFQTAFWDTYIPEDKFTRNSEAFQTTVSRFPTYEPCPEHESFSYAGITGYTPTQTQADLTYQGSGGAGNSPSNTPPTNTTLGANNKVIQGDSPVDTSVTKNFNMAAYECQLKIHEGVRYVSYHDSLGYPTGGIGHLLRENEIATYPVPTAISSSQVDAWFNQDAPTSIKGAQNLLGLDVWAGLSDARKRACADLCYNMGEYRLSKFKQFLGAMKASNWPLAGQSLQNSRWYTQVGRRGPDIIAMIVQNIDPNGCDKKFK